MRSAPAVHRTRHVETLTHLQLTIFSISFLVRTYVEQVRSLEDPGKGIGTKKVQASQIFSNSYRINALVLQRF